METQSTFADAIRKTAEAYAEALSAVMNALEGMPKQGGEEHRRTAEQWLRMARMSKDSVVLAIDQGFDLWETQCRRAIGAPHSGEPRAAPGDPPRNPMEAWAENWKKTVDAFTGTGQPGDAWSEAVRKQAEMAQQAWQEGLRAWQRLWPAPPRNL